MREIIVVFGIAFLIGVISMPLLIPLLYRLKFGQSVREEGLKSHYKKAGTPTMGGIMLYLSLIFGLIAANQWTLKLGILLAIVLGHGILGFIDDYIKSALKNPEGLSAKMKLVGQFSLALVFIVFLATQSSTTSISFPFITQKLPLGFLYWPLAMVYMVFFSNAVNIIDGVDGLCSGQTLIVTIFCAFVAKTQGQIDLMNFSIALSGALLAFLVFNHHPAKIFMGDTGSLGLGAALASLALLLKIEVIMLWVGIVFIVDIFSTIIQVLYFKKTGGKRFFKMSPIHHHFELSGWSEWKIVGVFWAWGLFFALTGWFLYSGMGA